MTSPLINSIFPDSVFPTSVFPMRMIKLNLQNPTFAS
jgi:hypothetical protein